MPPRYQTRLRSILMADAVGYSRAMAADEHQAVARLEASREHFRRAAESRGGRIVDMAGDSVLALFETARGAAQAAFDIQLALRAKDATAPDSPVLPYRIGLHLGDVIEKDDGTAYGDGVNVAARLQAAAEPGGIVASDTLVSAIRGAMRAEVEALGPLQLKNLDRPVVAFGLAPGLAPGPSPAEAVARTESVAGAGTGVGNPSDEARRRPSIAVVPFALAADGSGHEHLADGVMEDVTASLSRNRWFDVVAAATMFTFKGESIDPRGIGEELGVRYVLTGTMRQSADRVRLTAQLIDVAAGHQVWAERFDEPMSHLFEVQDTLSARVCAHLGASLSQVEIERARRKHPQALDTWDRFLLAGHSLRAMTAEGHAMAVRHLRDCIETEPGFAAAHARLALANVRAAHYGWGGLTGRQAIDLGRECAEHALALDPDNALALDALASVYLFRGELDMACAVARRAIEVEPSMTPAHGTLVNALAFAGRADEALRAFERCTPLSPRDPDRSGPLMGQINALMVARRFEDCVTLARSLLVLKPNWYGAHVALAVGLAHLGRTAEATEAATHILRLVPRFTLGRARRRPYFQRREDIDLVIDGLRLAGVPAHERAGPLPSANPAAHGAEGGPLRRAR